MLVIFPHPDDESVMAGGLIQRKIALGWRVVVVCLTRGEKGKIHINGSGRSIEEIRGAEFTRAMEALGVTEYELFNFPDGRLRTKKRWQGVVCDILASLEPDLVVTYDPSGVTGHPDHIALALFILKKLSETKGVKLLWPVLFGKAAELIVSPQVVDLLPIADWRIDLSVGEVLSKWRAISAHQSQGWAKTRSVWLFCLGWLLKHRYEEYAQADLSAQYRYRYVKFKF